MTTARFQSIGNILNRTASPAPNDAPTREAAVSSPETSPTPANEPRPVRARDPRHASTPIASRRGGVSAEATGGVRRIAFRLDADLYAALTTRAAADRASHGQVVLDSIEATHTDGTLGAAVAHHGTPQLTNGLFPRLAIRGPAQPTVPVEIRLPAQAVTVLDRLVEETDAQTRTRLIAAALHRHLT